MSGTSPDGGTLVPDASSRAISGQFTLVGCADLRFSKGSPWCLGSAPLSLQLSLISVGATMHRFQVSKVLAPGDGGTTMGGPLLDDTTSRLANPTLVLSEPGEYLVTLGVEGPGGTSSTQGSIVVEAANLGMRCGADVHCEKGLLCICKEGAAGCSGGLGMGLCSQPCDGVACPTGSVCVDAARGPLPAGTPGAPWQRALCVERCGPDAGCRPELVCEDLPLLQAGERSGGAYTVGAVCFGSVLREIGSACLSSDATPQPSLCGFGLCEGLGLRGACSATCTTSSDCPSTAACAAFTGPAPPAPSDKRCLSRCDLLHPCQDPLLSCVGPGGPGALGFSLPGAPVGTQICAPKPCTIPSDCKGGTCAAAGGASFCKR